MVPSPIHRTLTRLARFPKPKAFPGGCRTSGRLDRVVVAVEFAGAAGVEGEGLDRLVAGRAQTGEHLEDLVLPDVDGDREGDSRFSQMRAVAGLAHAVRGRGQNVVRDALHVIAGVDDDRA